MKLCKCCFSNLWLWNYKGFVIIILRKFFWLHAIYARYSNIQAWFPITCIPKCVLRSNSNVCCTYETYHPRSKLSVLTSHTRPLQKLTHLIAKVVAVQMLIFYRYKKTLLNSKSWNCANVVFQTCGYEIIKVSWSLY